MRGSYRLPLFVMLGFAALGALFAGTSTYDYIAHLDRQVHAVTCTYVPGLGAADAAGASGCFAVMMSPYAAWFRSLTWGGIPIALAAFGVFAYLVFKVGDVLLRKRVSIREETPYLMAAAALPLLMSVIYFIVSVVAVGVLCKVCVGIYVASIGGFAAAFVAQRRAQTGDGGTTTSATASARADGSPDVPAATAGGRPSAAAPPRRRYTLYFAEGVLFVLLPVLLYLALKPAYPAQAAARCGKLLKHEDTYGVRVKLHSTPHGRAAVELVDPLCPACKGLHERLAASGLLERLDLEGALFPLDKECNWMLSESIHPGACAVSEAVLCAGEGGNDVLAWSFAHQEELRLGAEHDPASVRSRVLLAFPELSTCMGRPAVRARLNKSLRWAVANSLPVLTPQLYIGSAKVCDEDTDLGLEYTLTRMLDEMDATEAQKPHAGASR